MRDDFRYAARSLLRAPFFTGAAIGVLALGIGGTLTAFSLTNAIFYRNLLVGNPDRLVAAVSSTPGGGSRNVFSYPAYERLKDTRGIWSGTAAFGLRPVVLGEGEGEQRVVAAFATPNYFRVLEVGAATGRTFSGADGSSEALPEVVVSHRLWRQRFGSDASLAGRTVRVNGLPLPVVGVAPEGFQGTIGVLATDVWISLPAYEQLFPQRVLDSPSAAWLQVFGRLAPGVPPGRAREALSATMREIASRELEPVSGARMDVVPLRGLSGNGSGSFPRLDLLLVGMALLVLAVASANVAGLLLMRAAARSGGLAVRAALGATRARLVRQQMAEVLLLWMAGGGLGLLLARYVGAVHLPALLPVPPEFPARVAWDASVDARTALVTFAVTLTTALAFGMAPALHVTRVPPVEALRSSDANRRRTGRRAAFASLQLAVSLVLLAVAGLQLRAVEHASRLQPGFDPDGVALASVGLAGGRIPEARSRTVRQQLLSAVESAPGVDVGALASTVPLVGSRVWTTLSAPSTGAELEVTHAAVSSGYFRTLRMPVLSGRLFADTEPVPVAILSRAAAHRLGIGPDPGGTWVRVGLRRSETHIDIVNMPVVGVVGDVQSTTLGAPPAPALFVPLEHDYATRVHLLARTSQSDEDAGFLGRLIRAVEPGLTVPESGPYRDAILARMPQRPIGLLVAGIAGFSLILAALGIYGTVGYAVAARTREIGVRMSLGAGRADVVRLVLRQVAVAFALGALCGLAASLAVGRVIARLLAGLSPADPLTLGGAVVVLFCATLLACLPPALRALRVDPVEALRTD